DELLVVEALHPLLHAVLGRDLQVVGESVVRGLERVPQLVALEDVVFSAGRLDGTGTRVDRATDGAERALATLDPDHDLLTRTVLPDSVEDPFGKPRARWLRRPEPQDTTA